MMFITFKPAFRKTLQILTVFHSYITHSLCAAAAKAQKSGAFTEVSAPPN